MHAQSEIVDQQTTHTLLTADDRAWLVELQMAHRAACDFYLADTFGRAGRSIIDLAKEVRIWLDGHYISVGCLLEQIEKSVPSSQIFEQWEYQVASKVLNMASTLPSLEMKALLVGSCFADADMDALWEASDAAVREAREALYGDQ